MISFKEIKKAFSDELNQSIFYQAMLKEYFQYKMLEIIFNSQWANNLIFLGGTNLRIIHNIKRFSEDIDFDVIGEYSDDSHEALCNTICKELKKEGYKVEIDKDKGKNKPQRTAFTRYINFPGLLKEYGLHDDPNKKFFIKIDAEAHKYGDFEYDPESVLINRFEVFTSVIATPPDIILSTKLCSILERSKGRDFYDIISLSSSEKANEEYIVNRFEFGKLKEIYYGPVHLQEKILKETSEINWNNKVKELERFLFVANEAKKIRLFNNWLKDKLFFRTFGLAYENKTLIDTSLRPIIRIRLNKLNPKYEISINIHETNVIEIGANRPCGDVSAGFKDSFGSKELHKLPNQLNTELKYSDVSKSILCLELNPESQAPVNLEVRFVKNTQLSD